METDSFMDSDYIYCAQGHKNFKGITDCVHCKLPLINFLDEVKSQMLILSNNQKSLQNNSEIISVGLGEFGTNQIINNISTLSNIVDHNFLLIGVDDNDLNILHKYFSDTYEEKIREKILTNSVYNIESDVDKDTLVWSMLLSDDSNSAIEDKLRRFGLGESSENQLLMLLAPLGEALASGIGPLTVQKTKQINSKLSNILLCTLPRNNESDQYLFNAYCGLSRFIKHDRVETDIIILLQNDKVVNMRGVDRTGKLVKSDFLIPRILNLFHNLNFNQLLTITTLAHSMRTQVFMPIYSYGRSYELYNSIANIIESSIYSPLSDLDHDSTILAIGIAFIPKTLLNKSKSNTFEEEFNECIRKKFPNLKKSYFLIVESDENSDRIDLLVLAASAGLGKIIEPIHSGYDRYKAYINDLKLWDENNINEDQLNKIENVINGYDRKIKRFIKKS